MLCPLILDRLNHELKIKNMNPDSIEANSNQEPIDVKGRLLSGFTTYYELPTGLQQPATCNDF